MGWHNCYITLHGEGGCWKNGIFCYIICGRPLGYSVKNDNAQRYCVLSLKWCWCATCLRWLSFLLLFIYAFVTFNKILLSYLHAMTYVSISALFAVLPLSIIGSFFIICNLHCVCLRHMSKRTIKRRGTRWKTIHADRHKHIYHS